MRVLLSAYACEPNRGSELGNGWNWAVSLAKAGHDVTVLTRSEGRHSIEHFLSEHPTEGISFEFINVDRKAPWMRGQLGVYMHYLQFQWMAYRRACRLQQRHPFDVAHHATWGSLHWGSWLYRLPIPFVFGPVGGGQVAPPTFKAYFERGWRREVLRSLFVKAICLNPLARRTVRSADVVLATNKATADVIRQLGAKQVELVLDTAVPPDFLQGEPLRRHGVGRELKILWVGRIFLLKGLKLALEGLSKVSHSVPFRLTIVGGGPAAHRVPEWTKEFGIEGKVDYLGQVPWSEVKGAYQSHDLMLFTSLRDSSGAQVLEALAFGLPLVALDHHGIGDFVPPEVAIKIPVVTPTQVVDGLAAAVESLYFNPALLSKLSERAWIFARENTWEHRVQEVEDIYRELHRPHEGHKTKEKIPVFLDRAKQ